MAGMAGEHSEVRCRHKRSSLPCQVVVKGSEKQTVFFLLATTLTSSYNAETYHQGGYLEGTIIELHYVFSKMDKFCFGVCRG